jgi:hypothetical protein
MSFNNNHIEAIKIIRLQISIDIDDDKLKSMYYANNADVVDTIIAIEAKYNNNNSYICLKKKDTKIDKMREIVDAKNIMYDKVINNAT